MLGWSVPMFLHCTGTETLRAGVRTVILGPGPSPQTAVPQNISPDKAPGVCTVPWEFPEGVPAPCASKGEPGGSGQPRGWGMCGALTCVLEAPVEALQLLLRTWSVPATGQAPLAGGGLRTAPAHCRCCLRGHRPRRVEMWPCPHLSPVWVPGPGGSKEWGETLRVITRYGCSGCALYNGPVQLNSTLSCASWSLCCPAPHTQWPSLLGSHSGVCLNSSQL